MGISARSLVAVSFLVAPLLCSVTAEGLDVLSSANCACIDDTLSFMCKTMGFGNTVWTGTSFNCPTAQNQIVFFHSNFNTTAPPVSCGTDIVGSKLGIDGNCYLSQLNVTVSNDVNNRTVQCKHNTDIIFTYKITVIQGAFSPPSDVDIIDIVNGQLVIGWSTVNPNCSSTIYLVTSNGACGICPNVTRMTNVTCSSLQLTTNERMCTIRVQSMICNYVSSESNPISATLRVPKMAAVEMKGHNNKNTTITIAITPKDSPFNITRNIPGTITEYKISVHNSMGIIMSSSQPSCRGPRCEYNLDFSSICNTTLSKVNVTVSAVNRLGEGPPSDSITIELMPLCLDEHSRKDVAVEVSVSVIVVVTVLGIIITCTVIVVFKRLRIGCFKRDQYISQNLTFCKRFNYPVDIIDYGKNRKYVKKEGTVLSTTAGKDKHAVSVISRDSGGKVGNIPRAISKICSDFLKETGTTMIECEVAKKPEKKRGTMSQDRREVQCIYTFSASHEKVLEKLSGVLKHLGIPEICDEDGDEIAII